VTRISVSIAARMAAAIPSALFVGGLTTFSLVCRGNNRPDFVVLIADDISWDDFGCYGNKVVKTPNIDRIAGAGMQFNNAFLTASSSSPSRCSIISGRYPHSSGAAELHTPLPADEIPFPEILKKGGYYTAQAGKWHFGPEVHSAFDRHTDVRDNSDGDGGENNWIKFMRERPKDKPFFFWFASHDAHRPWGADTFRITHDPLKIKVPLYLEDTPGTRQDLASYYNEIARFDYYCGEVFKELERQGALDNTVIIIMSDNGRPFPGCKTRVYDRGMKTPMIIHWPKGINSKGLETASLVSAVDIAPTILEIAGLKQPQRYQGRSFLPVLKDPSAEIRNEVFSEHNWHDYEAHERMVRTKDFLYVLNSRPWLSNCGPADSKQSPSQAALNKVRDEGRLTAAQADIFIVPRPAEELYDLQNDPDQLLNVASVPKYQAGLKEMRAMLTAWRNETGDNTPANLTHDWYDRETGKALKSEQVRGTMPGIRETIKE
jgi:N-sulfoglucosamine sulfohydrolase